MVVKGNISTFSNGYTIFLSCSTLLWVPQNTKDILFGTFFLPSPMGAQYSYRGHTSHVLHGTRKITGIGPWTAEDKKIDLWAAIWDKFKNHYIADCSALNTKSNSKTTYQVYSGYHDAYFFIIFSKNVLLSVLLQFKVTHKWLTDVQENYLKISQSICLSPDRRCYTRISEHHHDIYVQFPDLSCSNSGQTEVHQISNHVSLEIIQYHADKTLSKKYQPDNWMVKHRVKIKHHLKYYSCQTLHTLVRTQTE
jgi:hypothetical protein